jgi:hypothetical protein
MILNEFFNLPQVFEKDMTEGVMSEIDAELRNIVAREDFDALYKLFSADTPAGRFVQDMYDDVVIDTGLHPDDDFERIEQIVFDRLADDFGEQDVTEKRGDLRPKLGSARDRGKSVRQWRHNRGLDEQGIEEGNGRDLTNTPRDQFISRMTPSMDANALRQKVAKIVNSPGFTADTILQIVDAGDNLSHPAGRYIQQAFYGLQYNLGKEYEDYPERVAEKLLSQFRSMLPAYRVSEATTDMPFGGISLNYTGDPSDKPQQYHYSTEPKQSDKEKRQQRLLDVRSRKQDLLSDYAQLGALRVEMIYGINNDVFLNKEQLLDYFDHLVDDPYLTPLEYAHENGIPIDGLLKGMLRRAVQLGISALDVRKLWNSAKDKVKAKPGVAEGAGRAVNDKGLTQQRWLQLVQTKFPDAKIVQAKMIDGPCRATLPDGRTLSWTKTEQGVTEGMFGSRPNPVLPIVAKIDRVARELNPQNVETGKQIIQSHTRDITRMLSPGVKAGVDVIEAKDDYVPPKEADYGPEYQAMVKRVGQKAKQQEKAKQQQPKAPVRESRKALLKQIIQS